MSYRRAHYRHIQRHIQYLGLCVLILGGLVGWGSLLTSHAQDSGSGIKATLLINDSQRTQEVGAYQDIDITVNLEYSAASGDVRTVDILLMVSDGAEFVESSDFPVASQSQARSATHNNERLTPNSSRRLSTKIRPQSTAVGVYSITMVVTVDGQLQPNLNQYTTFTLGNALVNQMRGTLTNTDVFAATVVGDLLTPGDTGKIRIFLVNNTGQEDTFVVTAQAFTGLAFNGNNAKFSTSMNVGRDEIRLLELTFNARQGIYFGRYAIQVNVQLNKQPSKTGTKSFEIGYGPYRYAAPIDPQVSQKTNGLYVDGIAIPASLSLAQSTTGQILVWVENTLTQDTVRTVDLIVSDPVEHIYLSASGERFTSKTSVQIGPREGILVPINFEIPPKTAKGRYSIEVKASDPQGASTPASKWVSIELVE